MDLKIFAANIKKRRLIFLMFFMALPLVFATLVMVSAIIDTRAPYNADQQRYDRIMEEGVILAVFVFIASMIFFTPVIMIINGMFKRVLVFIKTLSLRDAEKLFLVNETEPFFNKYMPPYITKENTVTFFKPFHQNTIRFDDVVSIDLRPKSSYLHPAVAKITTQHGIFYYKLSKNPIISENLLAEARNANPNIIISENWN